MTREPLTKQCGVCGQEFKPEDIVIIEIVLPEQCDTSADVVGYPRVVSQRCHDTKFQTIGEMTYSELQSKYYN